MHQCASSGISSPSTAHTYFIVLTAVDIQLTIHFYFSSLSLTAVIEQRDRAGREKKDRSHGQIAIIIASHRTINVIDS